VCTITDESNNLPLDLAIWGHQQMQRCRAMTWEGIGVQMMGEIATYLYVLIWISLKSGKTGDAGKNAKKW
jgi:hypothetical protein